MVLFISSSPSSPFTSLSLPSSDDGTASRSLISTTRKTWFDLNHGYLFDPVLHAFSLNATIPSSDHQEETTSKNLPSGFLDLRYKGLGFVLDLGWTRTEEGMRWEIQDRIRARGILEKPPTNADADADADDDFDFDSGIHHDEQSEVQQEEYQQEGDGTQVGRSGTSWKDRLLGMIKGKSTGMLGDW